jgi:hypothetical protein
MNLRSLTKVAIALIVVAPVFGQEKPHLPFIDQGACPFECCTYREWRAKEQVVAFAEPRDDAAKAFTIKKGQWVTAETGFVVTTKVGITKVLKPITLGYEKGTGDPKPALTLKPGELLYTLHYDGEGTDLFWYKGKVYLDQISADKPTPDPPPPKLNLQVLSRPVNAWWVKIKTKDGRVGWIKNPPYFENSDACG